jgi:hypothetical protein
MDGPGWRPKPAQQNALCKVNGRRVGKRGARIERDSSLICSWWPIARRPPTSPPGVHAVHLACAAAAATAPSAKSAAANRESERRASAARRTQSGPGEISCSTRCAIRQRPGSCQEAAAPSGPRSSQAILRAPVRRQPAAGYPLDNDDDGGGNTRHQYTNGRAASAN